MSEDDQSEGNSANSSAPAETLAESFTQSKRELKFILGTWLAFFIWVGGVSHFLGTVQPGEPVPLFLGMPSWAFFGVGLPWLCSIAVSIFFGTRVMKDTDLGGDSDPETGSEFQ